MKWYTWLAVVVFIQILVFTIVLIYYCDENKFEYNVSYFLNKKQVYKSTENPLHSVKISPTVYIEADKSNPFDYPNYFLYED